MSQDENHAGEISKNSESGFKFYPSDLWKGFLKFWWICVVLAIVVGGLFFYKSYIRFKPVYSTESTFTVSTQSRSASEGGFTTYIFYFDSTIASQLSKTFPYFLQSNLLQDAICEDLQISYVPASLSASSVKDTNMFTITATGSDPEKIYDVLVSAMKNYPSVARYLIGNVELTPITEPYVPQTPINSSEYKSETLTGMLIGFAAGLAFVVLYALIRKTVRTKKDIKNDLKTELVGTLPLVTFKRYKKMVDTSLLITNERIGSGFKESLRVLRNTFINSIDVEDKVIMVTSTSPGEGKTTAVTNLAISLSDLGKRVLLIDCDLRNPSVIPALGIEEPEKKKKDKNKKEADLYQIRHLEKYGISIMSFSEDNGQYWNIVRYNLIEGIVNEVKNDFDYILIDTPPCGLVSDALVVAQVADCALYVVLQDTVRISRILESLDNLLATDVKLKGCILNGAQSGFSGYGKNYGYGYGYGYAYGYKSYGRYGYGYGYGEKRKRHRKK